MSPPNDAVQRSASPISSGFKMLKCSARAELAEKSLKHQGGAFCCWEGVGMCCSCFPHLPDFGVRWKTQTFLELNYSFQSWGRDSSIHLKNGGVLSKVLLHLSSPKTPPEKPILHVPGGCSRVRQLENFRIFKAGKDSKIISTQPSSADLWFNTHFVSWPLHQVLHHCFCTNAATSSQPQITNSQESKVYFL